MKTTLSVALASVLLVFFLSGCSVLDVIADKGGVVNDEALSTAEFMICNGASVGSIRRHYGTPEKAEVWSKLCNSRDSFMPTADGE